MDKNAELTLYRTTQEALTNIGKYAQCTNVQVQLAQHAREVRLSVRDDGQGFDTKAVTPGRHGLMGMRVRVESHGGRLEVESAPGLGTTITATLPASSSAPPEQSA